MKYIKRLTEQELRIASGLAKDAGMTVSEWVEFVQKATIYRYAELTMPIHPKQEEVPV